MAEPKFWKTKIMLAKIEATYGTDPTPTGAANAMLAIDVTFSPMEGETPKRNVETPYFGTKPFVTTAFRSTISFSVDAVGSGTAGDAPAWGPLLRACAVAEVVTAGVKVEYSPITRNQESVALYFDVDGTKHVMLGARGNCVIKADANGIPVMTFNFTSLFTIPTEAARPVPDYTSFQDPQAANKQNTPTFTIGGTSLGMRSFELDFGNDVQARMLVGTEAVRIVDHECVLKTQVEAVALTTYDPYTIAKAQTKQAVALLHGTVVGRKFQLDLPKCQQMLPSYQEQNGIAEWPLTFAPLPTIGNDDWKITLT